MFLGRIFERVGAGQSSRTCGSQPDGAEFLLVELSHPMGLSPVEIMNNRRDPDFVTKAAELPRLLTALGLAFESQNVPKGFPTVRGYQTNLYVAHLIDPSKFDLTAMLVLDAEGYKIRRIQKMIWGFRTSNLAP